MLCKSHTILKIMTSKKSLWKLSTDAFFSWIFLSHGYWNLESVDGEVVAVHGWLCVNFPYIFLKIFLKLTVWVDNVNYSKHILFSLCKTWENSSQEQSVQGKDEEIIFTLDNIIYSHFSALKHYPLWILIELYLFGSYNLMQCMLVVISALDTLTHTQYT